MCSPEVPDLESSLYAPYADQGFQLWLVNAGESAEEAYSFLAESRVGLPCLLDSAQSLYHSYPEGGNFAPFPLHVIIGRDGRIRYLARQYDAEAARAAIEAALAEP